MDREDMPMAVDLRIASYNILADAYVNSLRPLVEGHARLLRSLRLDGEQPSVPVFLSDM